MATGRDNIDLVVQRLAKMGVPKASCLQRFSMHDVKNL